MSRCDGMADMEVLEASAARRAGSNPVIGIMYENRLRGQAVKTSPFHGGNTGSIPVGVTLTF